MKFFISLITTSVLFFSGSLLAGSHAKTIMLSTKGPGAGNPFGLQLKLVLKMLLKSLV